MWSWASIALLVTLTLSGCAAPSRSTRAPLSDDGEDSAPRLRGLSGIAPVTGRLFVVVHDTKRDEDGPRLGVLSLDGPSSPAYRPLAVDWGAAGAVPSDLESICAVPGAGGEYVAVESAHRDGLEARIFHLRATGDRLDAVEVEGVGRIDLPPDVHRLEGSTLILLPTDELVLVLCERDERKVDLGRGDSRERFALLRWSRIDLGRHRLREPLHSTTVRASVWPEGRRLRTCSEVHYEDHEQLGPTLWISATVDPGSGGPFDSIVYRTALDEGGLAAAGDLTMKVAWRVRGQKIEGLASSPLANAGLVVATDEDTLGGEVRLLPPPP
jgi:hypothetical protein